MNIENIKSIIMNLDNTIQYHDSELNQIQDGLSYDSGYDQTLLESLTTQIQNLCEELKINI